MMEKKLSDGGVVLPNIKLYYHASLLVTCIDCWRLSGKEMDTALQQEDCHILLIDWMVPDKSSKSDLRNASTILKLLGKIWLKYI